MLIILINKKEHYSHNEFKKYIIFLNKMEIITKFRRPVPPEQIYQERIKKEIELFEKKECVKYILLVCDILDLIGNIPHIIRGSSGSSLVCYLLGITNIDPVKEKIVFERFLNEFRDTMPDVDFDFPYNLRDSIFKKIEDKYQGRVARISNHIHYREKSALRQAKKEFTDPYEIERRKEELLGTFKHYSLHCGGITIYSDKIPEDIILKGNQIIYDKDDISKHGLFKIDILSNRGLAQYLDIPTNLKIEEIPENDPKVIELFSKGDNIGITFAESPAMRKAFMQVKPKNIQEIAMCLALIRPAANDEIVYDDDAINYISELIHSDLSTADRFRKAFAKGKKEEIDYFRYIISDFKNKNEIIENLNNLRKYSFCKSHALSYAKLVWALGYAKVYYPVEFWKSTLKHCHSHYYKWVHIREAICVGIDVKYKDIWTSKEFLPDMYLKYLSKEDKTVVFRGLIATGRIYKKKVTFITIGYNNKKYINLNIQGQVFFYDKKIVSGCGKLTDLGIDVIKYQFEKD